MNLIRKIKLTTRELVKKVLSFLKKSLDFLRSKKRSFWIKLLAVLFGIPLIFTLIVVLYISPKLPDADQIMMRSKQSTIIYDREGKELFRFYDDKDREFVSVDEVSDEVKWSVLAAEDISFYRHEGLRPLRIIKCAVLTPINIVSKGKFGMVCGASTLSQQMVRNVILPDFIGDKAYERSLWRKYLEIVTTLMVETKYSKDEILEIYLNEVPIGGLHYGLQSGATAYFDKDLEQLTLSEAAVLAGLIQQPTNYNPIWGDNPEMAVVRRDYVLGQLEENIDMVPFDRELIKEAYDQDLKYNSDTTGIKAPHFIQYIISKIQSNHKELDISSGLKIYTTLDYDLQTIAEDNLKEGLKEHGSKFNAQNGGIIAIEPEEFKLRAMVGSVDYYQESEQVQGSYNTTLAYRQMGSSVKPYTYLASFEDGYGPWLLTPDIPSLGDYYQVENFDKDFSGLMTVRAALMKSRNIPALYTLELIGEDKFKETIDRLGISTLDTDQERNLGVTLGTAEMKLIEHTGGYAVLASGGKKKEIRAIEKVEGSEGEILYELKDDAVRREFAAEDVYMLNWILCDIGGFGDQTYSDKPYEYYSVDGKRVLCGKTGTTDGPRDLVAMQYHKNLALGVWIGNNDNSVMTGGWSHNVSLPIAHSVMQDAKDLYKPELFKAPDNIQSIEICTDTGQIAHQDIVCPKESSIAKKGDLPKRDERIILKLCKDSGLQASNLREIEELGLLDASIIENTLIKKDLESSKHQALYTNFLKSNNDFILKAPRFSDCKLPVPQQREGNTYCNGRILTYINPCLHLPDFDVPVVSSIGTIGISYTAHKDFSQVRVFANAEFLDSYAAGYDFIDKDGFGSGSVNIDVSFLQDKPSGTTHEIRVDLVNVSSNNVKSGTFEITID